MLAIERRSVLSSVRRFGVRLAVGLLLIGLLAIPAVRRAPAAYAGGGSSSPSGAPAACKDDTIDMDYSQTGTSPVYASTWVAAGSNASFEAFGQMHRSFYVGNGRAEYYFHVAILDPSSGAELWSGWNYAAADIEWGPGPYTWWPFDVWIAFGPWQNNTGVSQSFVIKVWADPSYAGDGLIWSLKPSIDNAPTRGSLVCFPMDPFELIDTNPSIQNGCNCNGNAADPVNTRTGAFHEHYTDVATIPGRGPNLSVDRFYNTARSAISGPFGPGWTHNFGLRVAGPDASGMVRVTQENGTVALFRANGSGGYDPPSRTDATLAPLAGGGWRFTRLHHATFDFNSAGSLTQITDRNGYSLTLGYTNGLLSSATDAAGRSMSYTWSGSGDAARITSVSDPSSPARTVSYSYDVSGRLVSVTDVAGGVWHYGYDDANRLVSVTKPRQSLMTGAPSVTNVYDASGRVVTQTDEAGQVTSFDYSDPTGTVVTDPAGHQTRTGYDSFGLLSSVTKGYGTSTASTWTYDHDLDSLGINRTVDPNGHVTTASYDPDGNRLSMVDPLGRSTTWSYNPLDEVLTETDPTGVTTTHTYDAAGNPLTVSRPLLGAGGTVINTAQTTLTYSDAAHPGDVTTVTDPLGRQSSFGYDNEGNVVSTTAPATPSAPGGARTTVTYNPIGWAMTSVSPRGNLPGANPSQYTTTYVRNSFGAVTSTTAPDGAVTSVGYDPNGNTVSSTDAGGHVTATDYDVLDRPITVHRADGSTIHTAYTPTGRTSSTTDGAGNTTSYAYDAQDRVTSSTDPLTRTTSLTYDLAGNATTKTAPGSVVTAFGHDADNQLTSIDYPGGSNPDVRFSYDGLGRKTGRTDSTGGGSWTYDSLGRLTSETGAGRTTGYHYDLAGQLSSIDYPNGAGSIARTYDNAGELGTVTDWHNRTFGFDYDADGNPTAQHTPNGTTTNVTVDRAGTVTDIAHSGASGVAANFASFDYTRDSNRQITGVTSTGVPAGPTGFGYDLINRLTTATTGASSSSYRYDQADNITRLTDQTAQQYDIANELLSSISPITYVSSTGLTDQTSTTMVVPFTSANTGDQVLLWVTTPASQSVTAAPSGYTQVGTWTQGGTKAYLYRHQVTATTDATVTVNFSGTLGTVGNYTKSATAVVYRGVDPTNPIDDTNNATANGGSVTVPSVSGTLDNTSEIVLAASHTANTATSPGTWAISGMTSRATATPAVGVASAVFDSDLIDAGPTGTHLATNTVAGDLLTVAVALKPARTTYTYDQHGNRTTRTNTAGTTTYTYNAADRLTAVSGVANYAYNGDGLRTSKTIGSTTTNYTWSSVGSLPLLIAENNNYYVYGPGDRVLERIDPVPPITYLDGSNLSVVDAPTAAVPVPSVQKRDLLVLATVIPADQTATTPSGYTLVRTAVAGNTKTYIWIHVATDNEPTTVNVSYSTGVYDKSIAIAAWRNIDPINPIATESTTTATATNTITSGTGTAANQSGNQAILVAGANSSTRNLGNSLWTVPSGMTGRPVPISAASTTQLLMADAAVPNGTVGPYTASNQSTGDFTATLLVFNHARPPGHYYHLDQLGSVRAITNEYADVTATRTYDPYGRPTTSATSSDFGYAGQYTDAETGLQYLRARYYDPSTAQFLSRDPANAASRDAYGYASRNPVNATDPSGLICLGDYCSEDLPGAQGVADFAGGVLNTVTLGHEQDITSALGIDDRVNRCSDAYTAGEATATIAAVVVPAYGELTAVAEETEAEAYLYQKLGSEEEHLKYGITKNPATRYTASELNGGRLKILASGSRQDMLALERSVHETLPIGPEEGQSFYIDKQVAKGLRPPPYDG